MKKLISFLLAALMVLSLAACGTDNSSSTAPSDSSAQESSLPEKLDVKCNVFALSGPTGVGLAPLMQKAEEKTGRLDYTASIVGSND